MTTKKQKTHSAEFKAKLALAAGKGTDAVAQLDWFLGVLGSSAARSKE